MTSEPDAIDVDTLLSHSSWVRRLARSLLFDQEAVDDIVQQTWVVALENRPRRREHTRAWLGGILRNVARRRLRAEGRRARHEARVAPSGDAPSTGALVAQADMQRHVVGAVLDLAEPYRTTVLMRYLQELSAEQIARRLGVPGSTVRARLKRALEQLRRRLDGEFGGERRSWSLGLIPLVLARQGLSDVAVGHAMGAGLKGVVSMTAQAKVFMGAVVLAGALTAVWWALEPGFGLDARPAPDGDLVLLEPATRAGATNADLPSFEAPPGALVAADEAQAAPATTAPDVELAILTGLVLDSKGKPVEEAELRFAWHAGTKGGLLGIRNVHSSVPFHRRVATEGVLTNADGGFELEVDLRGRGDGWMQRTLLVVLHEEHATRIHVNPPLTVGINDLGTIRLAPGAGVSGRVVDSLGRPLEDVAVELLKMQPTRPGDVRSGAHLPADRLGDAQRTVVRTGTDEAGRFTLRGLAKGSVDLRLTRPDLAVASVTGIAVSPGRPTHIGTSTLVAGPSIGGLVVDAQGVPIADARVYARHLDAPEWHEVDETVASPRTDSLAWTGADGRFLLGGLTKGSYSLHVVRERRTAFTHLPQVSTGSISLRVTLEPPGEILLSVGDARSGSSVEGATIWAGLPDEYEELTRHIPDGLRVQSGGHQGLEPGQYRITGAGREGTEIKIQAEGYRRAVVIAPPVPPGGNVVEDVLLDFSLAFQGIVIDEVGEPVADAVVQVGPTSGPARNTGTIAARSGDDGRFVFQSTAPGTWQLWAYADGHVMTTTVRLELPDRSERDYVIRLLRKAAIQGTVRTVDGLPAPGAQVVVARAEATVLKNGVNRWEGKSITVSSQVRDRPQVTQADETGVYRFNGLTPGRHVLLAVPLTDVVPSAAEVLGGLLSDLAPGVVERWLDGGETAITDLVLSSEGAVVIGSVTDRGQPVPRATIRMIPAPESAASWGVVAMTQTDEQGVYRLPALGGGPALVAVHSEMGFVHVRSVELIDGNATIVDIDLGGSTVAGRVVEATSGEPIAGARIRLAPAGEAGERWPSLYGLDQPTLERLWHALGGIQVRPETDDEGWFVAHHLPPRRFWISAKAAAHHPSAHTLFTVDKGGDPDPISLELQRAAVLEGKTLTKDGFAVDDVNVDLYRRGQEERMARAYPEKGRWRFDPLDVGVYEVRVVARAEEAEVLATRIVTLSTGDQEHVEIIVD